MSQPDAPRGIDPRGPRFAAAITAALLLVDVVLGLADAALAAWILLAALSAIFLWSAIAGVSRSPWGWVFRTLVRPRLAPPAELEDPRPPTFAQGVGFIVTVVGVVLGVAGLPLAVPIAAAFAFIAAFLNAAFAFCLGCQIYLLLVRARVIRPA
ncbi:DUF4395 family protein [Agromyces sp. MMS24-K17]|uniref:DUF4395 family protein n=1 Tax=Agromyces sp. MMS24-K17 TaxID=3372850 RepID=UPI0037550067